MVEVQTWDPSKIVQCDNNFGPFLSVFSPRVGYQYPSLNKYVRYDNKVFNTCYLPKCSQKTENHWLPYMKTKNAT
jgi:hypothetical protein